MFIIFQRAFFFFFFFPFFYLYSFYSTVEMTKKYNTYLNSTWWKNLSERRLTKNNRCESCKSKFHLQIHHFNYEHKYSGSQSKVIKHTKVLCSSCHKAFHDIYGVKRNMTNEMNKFLAEAAKGRKMVKEVYDNEDWIKHI